jgi:hypothetical protein
VFAITINWNSPGALQFIYEVLTYTALHADVLLTSWKKRKLSASGLVLTRYYDGKAAFRDESVCDKYSGGDTNTTHSTSMICATTGARMGCTGTWDVAKRTKHDFSTHYYDDKAAIRVRECLR